MKSTRQAILLVSRPLLEAIMPDWRAVYNTGANCSTFDESRAVCALFKAPLKLPINCCITGVSKTYAFDRDQIAFRIESPDFVEVPEGGCTPNIRAVYMKYDCLQQSMAFGEGSSCYFLRWDGPAVAVQRTYGPDGKEASALVQRVHDPDGLPLGPSRSARSFRSGDRVRIVHPGIDVHGETGTVNVDYMQPNSAPFVLTITLDKGCQVCVRSDDVELLEPLKGKGCGTSAGHLPEPGTGRCYCGALAIGSDGSVSLVKKPLVEAPGQLGSYTIRADQITEEVAEALAALPPDSVKLENDTDTALHVRFTASETVHQSRPLDVAGGASPFVDLAKDAGRGVPVRKVEKILEAGVWADSLPTYKGLPIRIEDGASPCWQCHGPTLRRLSDGTAECEECAKKGLL